MRVEGGEDENGGGARELVLELNQLMWVMGWSQYFGSPVPTDMVVLANHKCGNSSAECPLVHHTECCLES